jgi:hypothetical protein
MTPRGVEPDRIEPRVAYASKEELHPRFGYAVLEIQLAYVRRDLPGCVREFVREHELYHLGDKSRWWLWREIRANAAGALKHPLGFALCLFLSLTPSRLRYYAERVRRGE